MDIEDFYDHPCEELEYILENIPTETTEDAESFIDYVNSELTEHCSCAKVCENCSKYENERLTETLDVIHECNRLCPCDAFQCPNRVVQKGPCKYLVIKESPNIEKQMGLFTNVFLPKGTFICEYAGEIISKKEAQRREQNYSLDRNYIMCLNLKPSGVNAVNITLSDEDPSPFQTFIDPTVKGNIGRYLNHSCDPNCNTIVVRVGSLVPKVAFFTNRDIEKDTELTFSYGEVDDEAKDKRPCLCGTSKCKKYLPNLSFS